MRLDWITDIQHSSMYAGWCIARFPDLTSHCVESVRRAARKVIGCLASLGFEAPDAAANVFALVISADTNDKALDIIGDHASKAASRSMNSADRSLLAADLATLTEAYSDSHPKFANDMQLRVGPLRQQWEAFGPGLLASLRQKFTARTDRDSVRIHLVHPVFGGYGRVLADDAICIEAVLTNENPMLPEALRMAWLLGQLGCPSPPGLNRIEQIELTALATLPAALEAAEELGIGAHPATMLPQALTNWMPIPSLEVDTQRIAETLGRWWNRESRSRTHWTASCAGLQRELQDLLQS